jgi:hypothetical protein
MSVSRVSGITDISIDEEEHVGILVAVGAALGAWSKVESRLNLLFGVISGIHLRAKAGAVMDAIISFEARLAVCDRLMSLDIKDDPLELEMWARLSAKLRKFYLKRHEIAHFTLVVSQRKDGSHFPQISPFFSYEKWVTDKAKFLDQKQIEERLLKFLDIQDAMQWFVGRALARAKPKKYPMPDDEEPPLIVHIRELASRILEEREQPPPA